MKFNTLLFISNLILISCGQSNEKSCFLAQGIMAGEVTASSVILQSRITETDTLVASDIAGTAGIGKFEIATDSNFSNPVLSDLLNATSTDDYIIKTKIHGLKPGTHYYYRLQYGSSEKSFTTSNICTFKTLAGPNNQAQISMAIVTGMNYYRFHFGNYEENTGYNGKDGHLGYPALAAIKEVQPDYFIGTGDNVYFDHPNESNFRRAQQAGKEPHPGRYNGKEVTDETGMRRKYHEQFSQLRFRDLFQQLGTYWLKDDHDYRFNDADPFQEHPISHRLGIKNFKEQLPVVDPNNPSAPTYRTYQMSKDLQIWLVEGRDYRSANQLEDNPSKTLWGQDQLEWLKATLLASDATYKILISPTPLVGPDDGYKNDNHTNPKGFKQEGSAFFNWLVDHEFLMKNFYIICGDRHWQYHAVHPSGFEEFSTGALVDNNSRAGRLPGDPDSTDPLGEIKQHYVQDTKEAASGGFLLVSIIPHQNTAKARFSFYNEHGHLLYEVVKP